MTWGKTDAENLPPDPMSVGESIYNMSLSGVESATNHSGSTASKSLLCQSMATLSVSSHEEMSLGRSAGSPLCVLKKYGLEDKPDFRRPFLLLRVPHDRQAEERVVAFVETYRSEAQLWARGEGEIACIQEHLALGEMGFSWNFDEVVEQGKTLRGNYSLRACDITEIPEPNCLITALADAIMTHTGCLDTESRDYGMIRFCRYFVWILAFRMKYGHFQIPHEKDTILASFVERLRTKGRSDPRKYKALDHIGFDWGRDIVTKQKLNALVEENSVLKSFKALETLGSLSRDFVYVHIMEQFDSNCTDAQQYIESRQSAALAWARGHDLSLDPNEVEVLSLPVVQFDWGLNKLNIAEVLSQEPQRNRVVQLVQEPSALENALADRILQECGFALDDNHTQQRNYRWLLAFRMRSGHCSAPKKTHEWLGKWVENLRNQGITNEKLRNALDIIRFEWKPQDDKWEKNFAKLQERNKQPNQKYDATFTKWMVRQRERKRAMDRSLGLVVDKSSTILLERCQRLDDEGFAWNSGTRKEASWQSLYESLVEYKRKHHNCLVPKKWKDNKQLADWVDKQRKDRKKCEMALSKGGELVDIDFYEARVQLLDAIHFEWDV